MRKFRFIGDPSDYAGDFENRVIYDYCVLGAHASDINMNVEFLSEEYPKDWQEVTEPETKPLHKDTDLGYFAGLILSHSFGNPNNQGIRRTPLVIESIKLAKELIKQLDNEK